VVGDGAGEGGRALDRVQAVHGLLARPLPARGVLARVAEAGRAVHHEVRFQGEDHVRPVEVVLHGHRAPDGLTCRRRCPGRRLPLMPLRRRHLRQDLPHLSGQRGRSDGLGEDAHAHALTRPLRAQRVAQGAHEVRPGADLAAVGQGLRAVGVVQPEHPGLSGDVGRAETGGMVGVALDLGGAPEMALDQDALGVAAVEHGRGEEEGLAGHGLLRCLHVGHDLLFRLLGAAGEAGQGQRGPHQGEELPAALGIVELRGLRRELAVQEVQELRRLRQLLQALPVGATLRAVEAAPHSGKIDPHRRRFAHRWHVEQEVRVWIPYALTSARPWSI
jgi:hypothetical protein